MFAGRVACCPLVSHSEYANGTDGRTTDLCITLRLLLYPARVIIFGIDSLQESPVFTYIVCACVLIIISWYRVANLTFVVVILKCNKSQNFEMQCISPGIIH